MLLESILGLTMLKSTLSVYKIATTGETPLVIMDLEDVEILHVINNDVAQALVQMDIRPKEDILQNIVENGIANEELTQVRKTLFDEAVTTYEECIEMAVTLNG